MLGMRSKKNAVAETTAPDVYPGEPAEDAAVSSMAGDTCARCERPIAATDEARRTASGGSVHLYC